MNSNTASSQKQISVQELIQIILNEEKSKKYLNCFFEIDQTLKDKQEKMSNTVHDSIKLNGFEYFIDRLVEKQIFLSAVVRQELVDRLKNSDCLAESLRRKVV